MPWKVSFIFKKTIKSPGNNQHNLLEKMPFSNMSDTQNHD